MVAKKKTSTRSTTKKTTAVEAAVEQAQKGADDGDREARLQALRERRKEQADADDGGDDSASWQMSGEGSDRKREIVKKLITKRKKRMAQGGGRKKRMASGGARKKRMAQGAARKKRRGQSGAASEEGLAQYPRLKKMLAKRGGKKADDTAAEIQELEGRVAQLETAVETLLEKLEDARVLKS